MSQKHSKNSSFISFMLKRKEVLALCFQTVWYQISRVLNCYVFSPMGSHDEKIVCQKILEKAGLKGYQVLQNVSPE